MDRERRALARRRKSRPPVISAMAELMSDLSPKRALRGRTILEALAVLPRLRMQLLLERESPDSAKSRRRMRRSLQALHAHARRDRGRPGARPFSQVSRD